MKKKQFFFGFLVVLTAGAFFCAAWGEYQGGVKNNEVLRASVNVSTITAPQVQVP